MDAVERLGSLMRQRRFPWILVGVCALLGGIVSLLAIAYTARKQAIAPPSCFGIGWGCELDPGSTGAFIVIFWGIGLAWVVGVLGVTELFGPRFTVARSALMLAVVTLASGVVGYGVYQVATVS